MSVHWFAFIVVSLNDDAIASGAHFDKSGYFSMQINAIWLSALPSVTRLLWVRLYIAIEACSYELASLVVDRGFNRLFFLHASTCRDAVDTQFDIAEYPLALALFGVRNPCSQCIFAQ